MGLVTSPTLEDLLRATACSTSTWGGIYHIILDPVRPDEALRWARRVAVDALYPLEDSPEAESLSSEPGFRSQARSPWGPFDLPQGQIFTNLLGTGWLLGQPPSRDLILPEWNPADPLSALFRTWFGHFRDEDEELKNRFTTLAESIEILPDRSIPDLFGALTPIGLTGLEIEYTGIGPGAGVMVLDPSDPLDLIAFWNTRAIGGYVFPWIDNEKTRLLEAAGAWIDRGIANGYHGVRVPGDGGAQQPHIALWNPREQSGSGEGPEVAEELLELLHSRGITYWYSSPDSPGGWTGGHPLTVENSRLFSLSIPDDESRVIVPLPDLRPALGWRGVSQPGIVAAQIHAHSESGHTIWGTVGLPDIRALAPLLAGYDNFLETFQNIPKMARRIG
jgi:hypothetical protein